jgi:hypothetical protein
MRDYANMPVLKWEGAASAKKASAQIHHAEPLILQLPEDFKISVDSSACGCRDGKQSGSHIDCNAEALLKALAEDNAQPELAQLATTAHAAGQVADIDTNTRRIIIHD